MDHFLKRFTIIDFLSMFVPGGITILAWNYYMGGVTEPVRCFFGEQDVALAVYFVLISYLMGMVLQEMSKPLERRWRQSLADIHDKWQSLPKIKVHYQTCFGVSIETAQQEDGQSEVGRKIFLYVSDPDAAGSKLNLFQAFYCMGRNSVAAAAIICALSIVAAFCPGPFSCGALVVPGVSAVLIGIMYFRSRRFYVLTQERAYRDFLKSGNKEINRQMSGAVSE